MKTSINCHVVIEVSKAGWYRVWSFDNDIDATNFFMMMNERFSKEGFQYTVKRANVTEIEK